jgi:uncharacterized membrane protein
MKIMHPHRHRRTTRAELDANPELAEVVEHNICTLIDLRRATEAHKSLQDKIADAFTVFSGSMLFVYLHGLWFGLWILVNLHLTPFKPFDPFPFGLLTMIVSLEAIFLSTFVLISQNRMQSVADKRSDLDLQINLLAEHEITRMITLLDAIADHLGLDAGKDPEVDELKKDVSPEIVLKEIERREAAAK